MKTKIIDRELYREGIRQLRVMGIVLLVLLALTAVLIPIGNVISLNNQAEIYGEAVEQLRTNYLDLNPLMLSIFTFAAPLLTLKLFYFLDKREASDFYHAIPQTRKCLYISFLAALISWILILILVPGLLMIGICSVFSRYIWLDVSSVLVLSWHYLAAGLLVMAAVVFAMSLTGTLFTNIVVAGLVIFLPRLLLSVLTMSVNRLLPYVADTYQAGFLDYRINIISGTVFGVLWGDASVSLYSTRAGIYTLVLSMVYLLLAGKFFCHRRSESAGMAAISKRLQMVFRLTVAFVICLIPLNSLFDYLVGDQGFSSWDLFQIFVSYLIAVLGYLLYELIATRKWRNLLSSLPGLGILAAINIVMLFAMYGYYQYESGICPEADEISYVRILPEDGYSVMFAADSYGAGETLDYFRTAESRVELRDPEVKAVVAKALADNIDYYAESEPNGNQLVMDSSQRRTIEIHTGIRTVYRILWLKKSDMAVIYNALKGDEGVRSSYQQLPALEAKEGFQINGTLNAECMEQVYEALCGEISSLNFEEVYDIFTDDNYSYSNPWIQVSFYEGQQRYSLSLPISEKLPKTKHAFYQEAVLHHEREYREQMVAAMEDPQADISQLWIERMDGRTLWYASQAIWNGESLFMEKKQNEEMLTVLREEPRAILCQVLKNALDYVPEEGESCYQVYLEWYSPDKDGNYGWQSYWGYFAFEDGTLPENMDAMIRE